MGVIEHDRLIFNMAKEFLLDFDGVTAEVLALHLSSQGKKDVGTLADVYYHALEAAQSPNMMPSVIGGAIDGVKNLRPLLCEFEPDDVVEEYGLDHVKLLDNIVDRLNPRGEIRRTKQSLWPKFCETALSIAEFLSQFRQWAEFNEWLERFHGDARAIGVLPLLLAEEIKGMGFAVACEFLMEIGYTDYCKPDVHIKKLFVALNLADSEKDYAILKAAIRIAKHVNETPYCIDKLFWVIGSGKFFKSDINIGRQRKNFIAHAKKEMGL